MSYDMFRCTKCGEWIDVYGRGDKYTSASGRFHPPVKHVACKNPPLPAGTTVSADGHRLISPDASPSSGAPPR